jgi:hypothetical protein
MAADAGNPAVDTHSDPVLRDFMAQRLGPDLLTPLWEGDTRGYAGRGVSQATLDLCHAWTDPGSRVVATMRAALNEFLAEPFTGITTDGTPIPGLYELQDTGLSTRDLKDAADAFLHALRPEARASVMFAADADEWRAWINANEWANRHGILLRDLNKQERDAFEELLRASLSAGGFALIRDAMRLNEYLGEICEDVEILGEWTYWVSVFGRPSLDEPWGWQLDGHHVNLNVFVLRGQVVVSPMFVGAEPRTCEVGKFAGTRVLTDFDEPAVALMAALSESQRERATLFPSMLSADLPPELAGRADGRHRGGAMRDNLVLPYEGICAGEFDRNQQRLLLDVCDLWISRLPIGHSSLKMDEIKRHLDQSHFAWIGGYSLDEPFYFKVHSPVTLLEYDNHAAIFLGNPEPEKFHTHTVMRTPNGNDYGKDLLRQHYERYHR